MDANQKKFLLILSLYAIGNLVAITFANFYLWQQTREFQLVLFYNLAVFIGMAGGGFASGLLAEKFGAKKTYQAAMLLYILQLALLIFLGTSVANLISWLGLISGLAIGIQSFSFNVIAQTITNLENREAFLGTKTALLNLVNLLASPLVAIFAQRVGYTPLFIITIIIFLLIVITIKSLGIQEKTGTFSLSDALKAASLNSDLRAFFKTKLLYGLQDGLFWVSLAILTLNFLGSLASWGIFSSVFTLFLIIASYVYGKTIKLKEENNAAVLATFIFTAVTIVFVANWNLISFIAYQVAFVFLTLTMSVDFDSFLAGILDQDKGIGQLRDEYNAIGEVVINGGRLVPVLLLLLFHVTVLNDLHLRIAYLLAAPVPFFIMHVLSNTKFLQTARESTILAARDL